MENKSKRKIQYLIVDTSGFINNVALQEIGENIITVPEVVNEIKSKRQLRRLIVLPYDLQIKDSSSENIKFVNEFSKKTGDFISLSATDISVIALTYQFEKENNGSDHLHNAPLFKTTIKPFCDISKDLKNVAGFYLPKKHSLNTASSKTNAELEDLQYDSADDEDEFVDAQEELLPNDNSKIESKDLNIIKSNQHTKGMSNQDDVSSNGSKESDSEKNEDDNNDTEDDDSDWITSENINMIKTKISDDVIDDYENTAVACLTTDYAMQNVLKQIGLNVISLDGKLIKQLRTFVLRCYGCFKTTSIMTKVFCPNCGNKTLKKVGVSLNADGSQHLHINFRKPLTSRGKRFSLPLPKGGKHSNNPILCEDQPRPQQNPSHLSRMKNNPLNDDYIAGYSPFIMRDITSKSAMLGIRPHIEMKHWMRKNPNERNKKRK